MNRTPVINALLNFGRLARQVFQARNAFDEAVALDLLSCNLGSKGSSTASTLGPQSTLQLRDFSSNLLWLLACRRAHGAVTGALSQGDAAKVEAHLAHFAGLLRLSQNMVGLGILSPRIHMHCRRLMENRFYDVLRRGLDAKFVVPGVTRGIHARHLQHVRAEASVSELRDREASQREKFEGAVQKCFAGTVKLDFREEDLEGLPEKFRTQWVSPFGSWAVWRKSKYSVRAGRDAMIRLLPFCHKAETRARVFEAYFQGFKASGANEAALELLRTRRELARRFGFKSWAEYELRPLAVNNPEDAHRLLDRCWHAAQPSLAPLFQQMDAMGAASLTGAPRLAPRAAVGAKSGSFAGGASLAHVSHSDEAFFRAIVVRQVDSWKLAEFFPADRALRGILDVVGSVYNVRFQKVDLQHLSNGWRSNIRGFELLDGHAAATSGSRGHRLGYVYIELEQQRGVLSMLTSHVLPGAALLSRGHVYLGLNFPAAARGHNKLLNVEEALMLAHELGHAVHMLCHSGRTQDFDDSPLDLLELPSILAETVALHPGVLPQYAKHYASGGPPPESLAWTCHHFLSYNLVRLLQCAHVALGLHGEAFDPHTATPADLQRTAVELWQRYSPVSAHADFTPFGEDAGVYVALGAHHLAYLLCYLRVDSILHGQRGAPRLGEPRAQDSAQRWLSHDFAGRVRAQLLDKALPGERLAGLLLPPEGSGSAAGHPLPPPALDPAGMFSRRFPGRSLALGGR